MFSLASTQVIDAVDDAWYWMGGISLVLLVGIVIAMLYFVFRYSRKRHPKAADIHGNMKLEMTWIAIPTVIVLFMFWKGYQGFALMRDPPADAMIIEVEARQWNWTFRYPELDITSPELYVPVKTPVKLLLRAPVDDVVHSFYLPDFRVKEDCVPGLETYLWFQADQTGKHHIFCAEYCGKDHARMISSLHVLEKDDYEAWLDGKLRHRYRPVDLASVMDPQSEGIQGSNAKDLYATYCASCHGKEGRGGLVEGARNFRDLTDWKNSPKVVDIFRTLTTGLSGTQMRAFNNLSSWDRFALAYYVKDFYEGSDYPESTKAEFEQLIQDYGLDEEPDIQRTFPIDEAMQKMTEEGAGGGSGD